MANSYQPGETFTHGRTCDKYRPIYYAAVSGDFNPIHLDPEFGQLVGLGGNILHGMCTMAWAVEAAVNYLGDPGALKKVRVRFSRAVKIEDTVRIEGKVIDTVDGIMRGELTAKNQNGEDVLKGASFEARLPGDAR
jgi:acyl dehydratase